MDELEQQAIRKMNAALKKRIMEIDHPLVFNIARINRLEIPASNIFMHLLGEVPENIQWDDAKEFRRAFMKTISDKIQAVQVNDEVIQTIQIDREKTTERDDKTGKKGRYDFVLLYHQSEGGDRQALIVENKINNVANNNLNQYKKLVQTEYDLEPTNIRVVFLVRTERKAREIELELNGQGYDAIVTYDDVFSNVRKEDLGTQTNDLFQHFYESYSEVAERKWNEKTVQDNLELLHDLDSLDVTDYEAHMEVDDTKGNLEGKVQGIRDFGNDLARQIANRVLGEEVSGLTDDPITYKSNNTQKSPGRDFYYGSKHKRENSGVFSRVGFEVIYWISGQKELNSDFDNSYEGEGIYYKVFHVVDDDREVDVNAQTASLMLGFKLRDFMRLSEVEKLRKIENLGKEISLCIEDRFKDEI
jgi:hypothetical protein